ncbi:hypothetical protein [Demequina sp. NBRC 110054]|uniref:hypothetical protein n=1 Tax=Demequina sp. NBRC 110054 TaxID=1570343 RepID=UPI0009FBEBCB|nr:hypothetical protein [Demequina sp. NBRC 110054]
MAEGRTATPIVAAGICILALAGCSSGSADLEEELAQVTSERDALQAELDTIDARHDLVVEKKAELEEILTDHTSYGTPAQVADLLGTFATEDAVMDDDVYGAVDYRDAWYYTLYQDATSEVESIHQWVDADGSEAGTLWIWRGTNGIGNPFELIGISVDSYNDEGLITNEWVAYPYDDEYVLEALDGAGTATDIYGELWDDAAEQ